MRQLCTNVDGWNNVKHKSVYRHNNVKHKSVYGHNNVKHKSVYGHSNVKHKIMPILNKPNNKRFEEVRNSQWPTTGNPNWVSLTWQATGELGGISRQLKPPCSQLRTAQIVNGNRIWGHVRQITANGGGIHRENTKTRPDGACNKPVWGLCSLVLAAWKPDKLS